MSNLFEGGHGFFNIFKEGHLQKSLGNPGVKIYKKQFNSLCSIFKHKSNQNPILWKKLSFAGIFEIEIQSMILSRIEK